MTVIEKDEVAVVHVPKKKEEKKPFTVTATSLNDVFDQYQKKIYLFDESSSMLERLALEEGQTEGPGTYAPVKIDAVKKSMKRFVLKRFEKFPNAKVGVFSFDTETHVRCYAGEPKEKVIECVDNLNGYGGGTDIFQAVDYVVQDFVREPSPVQANQIILVTDGEDNCADRVETLLEQMKELNIVFDFIFVNKYSNSAPERVVQILKGVCSQTGGEYHEVNKESDFEQQFFKVSERRALPPARL